MTALAGDTFPSERAAHKRELRLRLLRIRRDLPSAERVRAARLTARSLLALRRIRRAKRIAIYLPMKNELDPTPLCRNLESVGIDLFCPYVDARGAMHFVPMRQMERGRRDALGMHTSTRSHPRLPARRFDVIILPLVGFDDQGHRIGMGAGYYDRSLHFRRIGRRPWLVGYAYPQQQIGRWEADSWDVKLDAAALSTGLKTLNSA